MAELGCCDRVMRNLSAINQMVDLQDNSRINALKAKKDAAMSHSARSKSVVMKEMEQTL